MTSGSEQGGSVAKWMEVGFGAAPDQPATPRTSFVSFFFPEAEESFGCMQVCGVYRVTSLIRNSPPP